MAPCQVSFDVQNPWGRAAPRNRTFTGHVFLLAHGHCWLQRDYARACAADFLPHNTRAHACTTTTKSTRFCLTLHRGASYHFSPLQATSPLPSQGPTNGWNCYVIPAFSEVPRTEDKIRIGYLTPAFLGAHKWAELLRNPLHSRGSPTKGIKSKVAALGARTKLWICSPEEYHQKNFSQMVCLRSLVCLYISGYFLLYGSSFTQGVIPL